MPGCKSHSAIGNFFCVLLYSVLRRYLFLCLDYPAFCLLVFTYNTQHKHPRPRWLFLFSLCPLPYFFVLIVLAFAFCPYNTHNRNIHVPRRDSNPQFQQASGHRPTAKTARPSVSAGNRPCNLSFCSAVTQDCATVYPLNLDIYLPQYTVQIPKGSEV